jgi:hypothetical protein
MARVGARHPFGDVFVFKQQQVGIDLTAEVGLSASQAEK